MNKVFELVYGIVKDFFEILSGRGIKWDYKEKEISNRNRDKVREYLGEDLYIDYSNSIMVGEKNNSGTDDSLSEDKECCIEPVDFVEHFVEHKDTLSDEKFNINGCDSCTLSDSTNTLSEGKGVEFQVNDCLYDYDEEVRVKNGVEGIARRYYGRKGVIKSILFINGKYKLGLKIHDRVNLLYLPEDSVDDIEDPVNNPYYLAHAMLKHFTCR